MEKKIVLGLYVFVFLLCNGSVLQYCAAMQTKDLTSEGKLYLLDQGTDTIIPGVLLNQKGSIAPDIKEPFVHNIENKQYEGSFNTIRSLLELQEGDFKRIFYPALIFLRSDNIFIDQGRLMSSRKDEFCKPNKAMYYLYGHGAVIYWSHDINQEQINEIFGGFKRKILRKIIHKNEKNCTAIGNKENCAMMQTKDLTSSEDQLYLLDQGADTIIPGVLLDHNGSLVPYIQKPFWYRTLTKNYRGSFDTVCSLLKLQEPCIDQTGTIHNFGRIFSPALIFLDSNDFFIDQGRLTLSRKGDCAPNKAMYFLYHHGAVIFWSHELNQQEIKNNFSGAKMKRLKTMIRENEKKGDMMKI